MKSNANVEMVAEKEDKLRFEVKREINKFYTFRNRLAVATLIGVHHKNVIPLHPT